MDRTVRGRASVAVCLIALGLLLNGCGSAGELEDVSRTAAGAAEQVEELEGRVAQLEEALAASDAELQTAAAERADFGRRLERVADHLGAGVKQLRVALAKARGNLSTASSNAASAVAEAAALARDLAVLQNRYDYHLRHYHGGG
jgi:chromosome segregation ATPase